MGPAAQVPAAKVASGAGNPMFWPHPVGHPGRLPQRAPVDWPLCLGRWQQQPLAVLQQAILEQPPSFCARSVSPERNGIRSARVKTPAAQVHATALARVFLAELERLEIKPPLTNTSRQCRYTRLSPTYKEIERKLCEWVLGRGTLPKAVFGDPRWREDCGDDNSASRMNPQRQHPKPDRRVAQRADTAEGCAPAIHTTRGGNDGTAIRIRVRALPAAALSLGLAAGHVRRRLAERPRGNGRQGREREHQSETHSHKAASPAKIGFRSEHPYWAKYSMFSDGATSFSRADHERITSGLPGASQHLSCLAIAQPALCRDRGAAGHGESHAESPRWFRSPRARLASGCHAAS
jgi:hypothetical protein